MKKEKKPGKAFIRQDEYAGSKVREFCCTLLTSDSCLTTKPTSGYLSIYITICENISSATRLPDLPTALRGHFETCAQNTRLS